MTVRDRIRGLQTAALGERAESVRPQLRRLAGYGLNFALGFVMTVPRIFGVLAPFGVAMVARGGAGLSGALCLVGAVLGYLVTGGFEWGIRYVAAAVLVFTAAFVFSGLKISRRRAFLPATAAAVSAVTGFLNSFDYVGGMPSSILLLTEVLLVGSGAYFFGVALSGEERVSQTDDLRYGVSLMILLACCLMALTSVTFLEVLSPGRLIAVLFVMTASLKGGMYAGCAAGTALGLAMDMAYGSGTAFTLSYAFAGLISGLFAKHGRLLFLLSYLASNALALLWAWSASPRIEGLYECFAAGVIFASCPRALPGWGRAACGDTAPGRWKSSPRPFGISTTRCVLASPPGRTTTTSPRFLTGRRTRSASSAKTKTCAGTKTAWTPCPS